MVLPSRDQTGGLCERRTKGQACLSSSRQIEDPNIADSLRAVDGDREATAIWRQRWVKVTVLLWDGTNLLTIAAEP